MDRSEKAIHKINVGADPKSGLAYYVGQVLHKSAMKITGIYEDQAYFNQFNSVRYVVVVRKLDDLDGKDIIWLHIVHSNIVIQYDILKGN